MAAIVVIVSGKAQSFELRAGANQIGRHPDSEIAIPELSVSGKHAVIHNEAGQCFLEDVGSRNGTFVNQQRLSERVLLKHNDTIQFGDAHARFDDPAARAAQPAGSGAAGSLSAARVGPQPGGSRLSLDDSPLATITGQIGAEGRFGALATNPEAKLKAVLEISNSLAGTVDLDAILPKILDTLFRVFRYADRGSILLKDDASGELVPRAMRHRRESQDTTVRLSRTVLNKVLAEKTGILSADAAADQQFSTSQSIADLNIRSMMCVPLLGLQGDVLGILNIDSQNPLGQFTPDDLEVLMAVAGQAALSYETARLVDVYVEKQKQDNELEIARSVQHALLPTRLPKADGYEFFASYDSAQAVGGDYYDCFLLPEGKICLSFGDVAGKGVPGALIMSRISSCVQSTIRHVHDVVAAINAINDHMCASAVEGRFVTYVLCFVDTQNHQVTLANAGHISPAIRHADGTVERFNEDLVGPPIGVVDGYPYEAETRPLAPGDLVVITTDGVDEAMDPQGNLYGSERVVEFVRQGPAKADELGRALLADVRRHANGRAQNDDITIMTFGRNPNQA
jgi:serine phosphatase RsbU (regulator of sigma subunit)